MNYKVHKILNFTINKPTDIFELLYLYQTPDIINIKLDYDMFVRHNPRHKIHLRSNIKRHNILKASRGAEIKLSKPEQAFYDRFRYELLGEYISYKTFILMFRYICFEIYHASYSINMYDSDDFPYNDKSNNTVMVCSRDIFHKRYFYHIDRGFNSFVLNSKYTGCLETKRTYPDNSIVYVLEPQIITSVDEINTIYLNKHLNVNKIKTKVNNSKQFNQYINVHLSCKINTNVYKSVILWLYKQYKNPVMIKTNVILTMDNTLFEQKPITMKRNNYSEYLYLTEYPHIPVFLEVKNIGADDKLLKYYNHYNGIIVKDVSPVI